MNIKERRLPSLDAPWLSADGRWLVIRFGRPHIALSWAVAGGGRRRTRAVAWRYTTEGELGPAVDAERFLHAELAQNGLEGAVGLMTGRALDTFEDVTMTEDKMSARCVATVGLSNALAAGDGPWPARRVGTINLLVTLERPLSENALLETMALAAEARAAALLDARVRSRQSTRPATGTGTDCIVVAAPEGTGVERYAGKHTALGAAVGAAVREATFRGALAWVAEYEGGASQ
jgi:adenosylcobinamide amidohydrolase